MADQVIDSIRGQELPELVGQLGASSLFGASTSVRRWIFSIVQAIVADSLEPVIPSRVWSSPFSIPRAGASLVFGCSPAGLKSDWTRNGGTWPMYVAGVTRAQALRSPVVGLPADTLVGIVRRRMIILALMTVLAGLGFRSVLTARTDLGPADLERFESRSGVDLPDAYGKTPFFLLWTRGDGQAYVTLAADLDLDGPAQHLLLPSYRYTRVGYAWLGRIVALGRVAWVPVGLMLVNLTALAAIGALTGRLVHRFGERAYLVLLNPGLYVGFATDTAEPLGLLLLMVAVVTGSVLLTGVASFALGTVRPSFGIGLPARGRNLGVLIGSVAGGALLIRLIALLAIQDNTTPIETLGLPFAGYWEIISTEPQTEAVGAALLLFAALTTAFVGGFRRSGAVRIAWLANAVLMLCLGPFVLNDPFNWTRAAAVLPVLWALPIQSGRASAPQPA